MPSHGVVIRLQKRRSRNGPRLQRMAAATAPENLAKQAMLDIRYHQCQDTPVKKAARTAKTKQATKGSSAGQGSYEIVPIQYIVI